MYKIIKTRHINMTVDLTRKIVATLFSDEQGEGVEVWLNPEGLFELQALIDEAATENPEMRQWLPNRQ